MEEKHRRQEVEQLPDRRRHLSIRPPELPTETRTPAASIKGPNRLSGRRHQAIRPADR